MSKIDKLRRKWDKWARSVKKYGEELARLRNLDKDKFDVSKYILDKSFGGEVYLSLGPLTIITDIDILTNPNTFLPGYNEQALGKLPIFKDICAALGREIREIKTKTIVGRMIGIAYNQGGFYCVMELYNNLSGRKYTSYFILNTYYEVADKKEDI